MRYRVFLREWAAYLLLATSASVNILLAVELYRARVALEPPPFAQGRTAPAITLRNSQGRTEVVNFAQGDLPVLFYWFSPECSWCEVNVSNFLALAKQAEHRYRFIPVSRSSPRELAAYSERITPGVRLYSITSESVKSYRSSGTPETLLVSARGEFIKRWIGAYPPSALEDIEKTLRITLPGLNGTSGR